MKKIQTVTYYGTVVCVRIELRQVRTGGKTKTKPCAIFSARQNGKIIYEHPPRHISAELEAMLQQSAADDKEFPMESMKESNALMCEFFQWMFTADAAHCKDDVKKAAVRDAGIQHRRDLTGITLGAMLAADHDALLRPSEGETLHPTTKAVYEKDLNILRKKEGYTLWSEVSAAHCGPWLVEVTENSRKNIKRFMLRLTVTNYEFGVIDDLQGWDEYDPSGGKPHRKSAANSIRVNILPTMLTYGDMDKLFPVYDDAGNIKTTWIDVAILLMATLPLSEEDICALDCSDVSALKSFPDRLTITINKKYIRPDGNKHHGIVPIEDANERRKLPLSHFVGHCIFSLPNYRKDAPYPLIPHLQNRKKRMSPEDLRKAVRKRVSQLDLYKNCYLPLKDRDPAEKLLRHTAERELRKAGAEEEELRFIRGKQGKLVSARHYADYMNESELNRLGSLMDLWLSNVRQDPAVKAHKSLRSGKEITWRVQENRCCTEVDLELDFPADADAKGDAILLLGALHGFSGTLDVEMYKEVDTA